MDELDLTAQESEVLADVETILDGEPDAVGAMAIPPFVQALLLSLVKRQIGPPLLAFVGKELLKEKIPDKATAEAFAVGALVDLGAVDHARGREWTFPAVAGAKRGAQ